MGDFDPGQVPSVSYASINVLIVDDNPANREAFDSVIQPLGYTVHLAESGARALQLANRYRFSVALLDVRMPLLNGLETASELRKTPFNRSTPIIFVSAYEESHLDVSRSGLGGPINFIFSPVNPEILVWKVQGWIEVGIRQELLRRQVAKVSEAQETLHDLIGKTTAPSRELTQADERLASALRSVTASLSEGLRALV
jgi:CheY-like chemotaxis protein